MKTLSNKLFSHTVIKYFFSYLLILTVLISGFFFIMRSQLTDRYFEQLVKQTENQLDDFADQLNDDITHLYQIDYSLANNLNLILSRYKNESYYHYQTVNELKKYGTVTKLIDSIIYKTQGSDSVISTNQPVTYQDGQFFLKKTKTEKVYTTAFDASPYYGAAGGQLIFLTGDGQQYLIYFPKNEKNANYTLFYILNQNELKSELKHFLSEQTPAVALVTADRQVVVGLKDEMLLPYLDTVNLESGVNPLDNSTSLCVISGIANGYSLITLLSNDPLFHQINQSFASSYLMLMVLGVIGFLLVTVAMRLTYTPLHRLSKQVVPELHSDSSFIEQINTAFSKSAEHNQLLQGKLDNYRLSIQKNLLSNILTAGQTAADEAPPNIDQFFAPDSNNEIFVIRMMQEAETLPVKEILTYLRTALPGADSCILLENTENSGVFLVNYTGMEQNKNAVLKNLLTEYHEENGYFCALSNGSSSPLDIPSLYENAAIASSNWPKLPVVDYTDLPENSISLAYPYEKLNSLSESLNTLKFDTAKQLLAQLYQLVEDSASEQDIFPDFFIKCVLVDILSVIISSMNQSGIKFKAYSDLYFETLFYCRSCPYQEKKDDIRKNAFRLLEFYEEEVSKKIVSTTELEKIMEESFCQPDFSITVLADRFHVSIAYMSYLIKKELNLNFSDYLWNLRLNKAKKLLEESDMLIDDICKEVGYLNTASFRRKFKQDTGMTPSQYRTQAGK